MKDRHLFVLELILFGLIHPNNNLTIYLESHPHK
nr:MAG TPA: hypothetical protein [Caudoviricetes sp.]